MQARISLESGIGIRLKGAYACYQAGMQLECLRHILLAINMVCRALGWEKASAYIDQQNRVLLEMAKEEEPV